jgi:hypothetical protein
LSERWPEKREPTHPGNCLQHTDNPRHESRFEDEIPDQNAPESKKHQVDVESISVQSEENERERV